MTSTPSTRRQLDGVALWSITARSSQHGRVRAEQGLRAPNSLFDVRTGVEMEFLSFGQFFNGDAFTIGDFVDRIRGKVGALKK